MTVTPDGSRGGPTDRPSDGGTGRWPGPERFAEVQAGPPAGNDYLPAQVGAGATWAPVTPADPPVESYRGTYPQSSAWAGQPGDANPFAYQPGPSAATQTWQRSVQGPAGYFGVPPTGPQLATAGRRLAAVWIDGLAILLVVVAVALMTTLSGTYTLYLPMYLAFSLFNNIVGFGERGRSIGKHVLQLRIVDSRSYRPISWGQAAGRYAVSTVAPIVPIAGPLFGVVDRLFIFSEGRRTLHDRAAGTVVVRES